MTVKTWPTPDGEDRFLTEHGLIARHLVAWKRSVLVLLIVFTLGVAGMVQIYLGGRRAACETRNAQIAAQNAGAVRGREVLQDVAEGLRKDGAKNAAKALEHYIVQASQAPRLEQLDC